MKKIFTLTVIITMMITVFAQAPQKISYQCVVRNSSGALVTNHAVGMKISVLRGSASGTLVFSETYNPNPQTNANGLISIDIGSGTPSYGTITTIDWANGPYFLRTETDPSGGTNYAISGTSQLLSVPYALYTKIAESIPDNSVTSPKIANGAVTGTKISQAGASSYQVLKWNGTTWAPANDDMGGLTLPYVNSVALTTGLAFDITSNGANCIRGTGLVGVIGVTNATGGNFGMGVSGSAHQTSGNYFGVYGTVNSTSGVGVYGLAFQSSGVTKGVYGETRSPSGYGVQGLTTNSSGYSGYFTGGKFYVGSKVGIGTTSPVYDLEVAGIANLNKGIASGQALLCNGSEAIWYNGTYFSWGYGGTYNYFKDAVGIDCFPGDGHMLAVNGVASKPGGGTWATFSDIRLKDIHGNYERGLEEIIRLEPVRFNYKDGNELKLPSNPEYVGFIAQDVEKLFPETITETPSGFLEFDMNPVNVAVINAVKELNQKIESQQREIDDLKNLLKILLANQTTLDEN